MKLQILSTIRLQKIRTVLKEALISRTAITEEQNVRTLLSGIQLGDRTPSQLLRHMRTLMGKSTVSETILKELWLQSLPPSMRPSLAVVHADTALETLSQLADQVYSAINANSSGSVQPIVAESTLTARVDSLEQKVDTLTSRFDAFLLQHSQRGSHSRSRSPTGSNKGDSSKPKVVICRYHRQFGSAAKSCKPYCTFHTQRSNSGNREAKQ